MILAASPYRHPVQVKSTSPRRVGYDPKTGEFVVFDKTHGNTYHGHVRRWNRLTDQMKRALVSSGVVDQNGRPRR